MKMKDGESREDDNQSKELPQKKQYSYQPHCAKISTLWNDIYWMMNGAGGLHVGKQTTLTYFFPPHLQRAELQKERLMPKQLRQKQYVELARSVKIVSNMPLLPTRKMGSGED